FDMVITDMKMENERSGYEVVRAAKKSGYRPATAILTAYPMLGNDWKQEGAESMLVKPMNTDDLLRQIEVLLIQHADVRAKAAKAAAKSAATRGGPESAKPKTEMKRAV